MSSTIQDMENHTRYIPDTSIDTSIGNISTIIAQITTITPKDLKWIEQARHVAETWSKDPSTKVGCVIVDADGNHLTQGYNGFIRGHSDDPEIYADRDQKYVHVIHAETNAVYNAARQGVRLMGATAYIYGLPTCNECAKALVQSGIVRVVMKAAPEYSHPKLRNDRWKDQWNLACDTYRVAGVKIDQLIE